MQRNKGGKFKFFRSNELYGSTIGEVVAGMLAKGSLTLRDSCRRLNMKPSQVKNSLCVLIHQHIAGFKIGGDGLVYYTVNPSSILLRPRFPRYAMVIQRLYQDTGELIIEELLMKGELTGGELISRVRDRLIAEGNSGDLDSIRETFVDLVHTHFLRRCPAVSQTTPTAPVLLQQDTDSGFLVRDSDFTELNDRGVKRKFSGTPETKSPEDPSCWYINPDRFHQSLRDQLLVTVTTNAYGPIAGEIVQTVLRLSVTTVYRAASTEPISTHRVHAGLPGNTKSSVTMVTTYLNMMAEDPNSFVSRAGDDGGGMFSVNIKSGVQLLVRETLVTIVMERFGSKSARLFRLILEKGALDQKQIESIALLPPKETKQLLYQMFLESYVYLREIPRSSDRSPSRTLYYFSVDIQKVVRVALGHCYKTLLNLMLRREKEASDNRRLLDQGTKVDSIVEQLTQDNADPEQIQEVRNYLTPAEKVQLELLKKRLNAIQKAEVEVDETVFILSLYLEYLPIHGSS